MEEKNLNEIEVVEENKEVVETEVVEETPVEAEVVEDHERVEEPEFIELEVDVTIEEETYVEYFKSLSFKAQLKSSVFFGIVIVLLSYFFRGEQEATQALLMGLLWGAAFIVITVLFSYITLPRKAKSTYQKSQINGLVLKTKFTNLGITQSIENESVSYRWGDITNFMESDISFFGNMMAQKRVLLMSKKNLTEEEIQRVHEILVEHLGESKVIPMKSKRK